jgi:predicted nucleic-acid-binding Zn-ribbon protein
MSTSKSKRLKNKNYRKHKKNKTLRGGKNTITGPKIKYANNSLEHKLSCMKCNKDTFTIKTLTMGTKLKTLLGFQILDNRFKVFTCNSCGFVQLYSNNITCDGKQCDPIYKV